MMRIFRTVSAAAEFGSYGGDVHFDSDENWISASSGSERDDDISSASSDFFTVAVHELGHALGLSHSPVRQSIMFPYYKGPEDPDTFSLGYDDILAMYELYSKSVNVSGILALPTRQRTRKSAADQRRYALHGNSKRFQ